MDMKVVLASKNKHKLAEISKITEQFGIELVMQSQLGVDIDVEETGTTFMENARIKDESGCKESGLICIADDSGLCVDALDGRPGVYSARYAPRGQECAKLIEEMKDIPDEERTASFQCVIAYIDIVSSN